MKPSPTQVREWMIKSKDDPYCPIGYEHLTKLAELAAQWGYEQAKKVIVNTRDDNPAAIHDKSRPRCICCGGVVMQEQGGGVCVPCFLEGEKP